MVDEEDAIIIDPDVDDIDIDIDIDDPDVPAEEGFDVEEDDSTFSDDSME